MTALMADLQTTLSTSTIAVPDDGPYRVVLSRLQRLVTYRQQLQLTIEADPNNQRASAELVRIGHMIREVHRAVSLNATARLYAQRIDPDAPDTPPPARLTRI